VSLGINTRSVTAVLLADGWHPVIEESFCLDAYEYESEGTTLLAGGSCPDVPHTGFILVTTGQKIIAGPLTSLLAVEVG